MIRRFLRHIVARVFDWAYTAFLEEESWRVVGKGKEEKNADSAGQRD